jgi:curved DNA-binding protein CbpA
VEATDGYRVLGVDLDVEVDELKAAYRYLSKKYHPDRSGDPNTGARFVRVVKAYKTLTLHLRKESLLAADIRDRHRVGADDVFSLGALALSAADARERRRAVRRLGFTGRKAAYVFLRRALSDADEAVVEAAVRSIADLSAFQASGELAALYARSGDSLRRAILDAAEATGETLFAQTLQLAGIEGGSHGMRARRLLAEMAPTGRAGA